MFNINVEYNFIILLLYLKFYISETISYVSNYFLKTLLCNKKLYACDICILHLYIHVQIFIHSVLVGRVCIDKVDYCHRYSKALCFQEDYIAWAQMNCPDYCGFCQSIEVVLFAILQYFVILK